MEHVAGYVAAQRLLGARVPARARRAVGEGKELRHLRAARAVPRDARRDRATCTTLAMWLTVNGERKQNGTTRDLVFGVPTLVSYVSQFMTLLPGDVISTGTPAGVAMGHTPVRFLQPATSWSSASTGSAPRASVCGPTRDWRAFADDHPGRGARRPLSDVARARRLRRDEPRSRLLGRLCHPAHRRGGWARGPWADVHDRPRQRAVRRGGAGAGAARRRAARSTRSRRTWARFWRRVAGDSQLRWVGPEKGVIHLATAAVVNAVWDLWAKVEGKPLWKLLADMTPEEIVRCIDFRYITDALTPDEALAILRRQAPSRAQREARDARATAIRRTRPRPAGWATRTTRSAGSAARGSRRAGRTSRSRSARPRRRHPPRAHHPRGDRPGSQADDGREPGLGRRRGDRQDARARALRSVVDRGADEPGRRARPRGDRARGRADRRRDRRALPEPRRSSSSSCRPMRSASARSIAAGWAA